MRITTGDLLHGDENGVVLVPREVGLDDLAGAVARVQVEDAARIELTRQADFSLDSVRDDLARHPPDLATRGAVQP
jgi:regulator of RNase E activity RraA